ncbi:DUF309 domain-containing protein [Halobacillus sp. BBL2006]|uniref:DUF309 domain-containing protein n=1 Tax=Halobacillus sp. BBL2006 TaxID=1543706 RepID=UPI00054339ED|nr:DUF309 domain-containing protein [Halobacillus sp. BBL2006]KHE72612.1 hypothetical protein LD39_03670 [Halobacillus sp. BBL2006]
MYPNLYIEYLAHFHGTRDYFECHEVLEEHWKNVDPKNRNSVWVFLIQLAVCMYHYRRKNFKGAKILIERCAKRYEDISKSLEALGLEKEEIFDRIGSIRDNLNNNQPYRSFLLPIYDPHLKALVKSTCDRWGVSYGLPSNLSNYYLIHKHSKRRHK